MNRTKFAKDNKSVTLTHYCPGHWSLFLSPPQVHDVYTDKTDVLTDSTVFEVAVNPTGVVMWYVSAPAQLQSLHFLSGGKRHGAAYHPEENGIPRGFLWSRVVFQLFSFDQQYFYGVWFDQSARTLFAFSKKSLYYLQMNMFFKTIFPSYDTTTLVVNFLIFIPYTTFYSTESNLFIFIDDADDHFKKKWHFCFSIAHFLCQNFARSFSSESRQVFLFFLNCIEWSFLKIVCLQKNVDIAFENFLSFKTYGIKKILNY